MHGRLSISIFPKKKKGFKGRMGNPKKPKKGQNKTAKSGGKAPKKKKKGGLIGDSLPQTSSSAPFPFRVFL